MGKGFYFSLDSKLGLIYMWLLIAGWWKRETEGHRVLMTNCSSPWPHTYFHIAYYERETKPVCKPQSQNFVLCMCVFGFILAAEKMSDCYSMGRDGIKVTGIRDIQKL